MEQRQDFYEVLQVDPRAHPEVIHAAYRTLIRVLGKHPDLGGSADEAQRIIEAYTTLGDPGRRALYDRWRTAHASATAPSAPTPPFGPRVPHGITTWLFATLPDYRQTPYAPLAHAFDFVLERPSLLAPRVYVKAFSIVSAANRATIEALCRAISVARPGLVPSNDALLVVARQAVEPDELLVELSRYSASKSWNRSAPAILTSEPLWLHLAVWRPQPKVFHRLRRALAKLHE